MILTDEDLKSLFPFGMAVVEEDNDSDEPNVLHGSVTPSRDNDTVFRLWVTPYADSYFPREYVEENGKKIVTRNGVRFSLHALPESRKVDW